MMGFDNECIKNIQSLKGEYFCPVCRTLVYPNEALQTQCSHLYCKPCLAFILQTTRTCPYDGVQVSKTDLKPILESNPVLADEIWQTAVRCLFEKSGCIWEGQLSECLSHTSGCAFGNSPVKCNQCGKNIIHKEVKEHTKICPPKPQVSSSHAPQFPQQQSLGPSLAQSQLHQPQIQPLRQSLTYPLAQPYNHQAQAIMDAPQIQPVGQQSLHHQVASLTYPQTQHYTPLQAGIQNVHQQSMQMPPLGYTPPTHPQPCTQAQWHPQPFNSQIASHNIHPHADQPYFQQTVPQQAMQMPRYGQTQSQMHPLEQPRYGQTQSQMHPLEQPRHWLHSSFQNYVPPQNHQPSEANFQAQFYQQSYPNNLNRASVNTGLHQGPVNRVGVPIMIPLQRPLLPLQPPQRLNNGMIGSVPLRAPEASAGQLRPLNPMEEKNTNFPSHGQEAFVQLPSSQQSQYETLKMLEEHLMSSPADHAMDSTNSGEQELGLSPSPPGFGRNMNSMPLEVPPSGFGPVPTFGPSHLLPMRQGSSVRILDDDPRGPEFPHFPPDFSGQAQGFGFPGKDNLTPKSPVRNYMGIHRGGFEGVSGGNFDTRQSRGFIIPSNPKANNGGVRPSHYRSGENFARPRGGRPPLPRRPITQQRLEKRYHGNLLAHKYLNRPEFRSGHGWRGC